MIALKWLLVILGIGMFGSGSALVIYDVYVSSQLQRLLRRSSKVSLGGATTSLPAHPFGPVRWQRALQLAGLTVVPAADFEKYRRSVGWPGGSAHQPFLGRAARNVASGRAGR